MAFFYERTHHDTAGVYTILGVKNVCPPQGCRIDPPEVQDCTVTAPASQIFDWAAAHNGVEKSTTSVDMSIKDPSDTLVLSQNVEDQTGKILTAVCPEPEPGMPAVPAVHVEIEDSGTAALGIVSVRIYAKRHPGSTLIDFYALIGVDPNVTYPPEPVSNCVTGADNTNGWYDLYWALSQDTVSEQTLIKGGTILLLQGF